MKKIYCVVLHIYDLIFFYRLQSFLNSNKKNFLVELVISSRLYEDKRLKQFVEKYFKSKLIIPIYLYDEPNFAKKIYQIYNLKFWVRSFMDKNNKLLLLDRSSPLSRMFIKEFHSAILIQQVEFYSQSFQFDYLGFVKDFFKSLIYGSILIKHYKINESNNHMRYLEFFKRNKPKIIFQTHNKLIKNRFELPRLEVNEHSHKIAIFGNRFLTWEFFKNQEKIDFEQKILNIYKLIYQKYQETYKFIYLKHPRESEDEFNLLKKIFNNSIQLDEKHISSEAFLIENRDIERTFSINSTSSHSSYSMGFKSKVFYKMLGLNNIVSRVYDHIFNGLPEEFFAYTTNQLFTDCKRNQEFKMKSLENILLE